MAIILPIKVQPQSGRQQLVWDAKQGVLKAFLKSAPEKNRANDELCLFLSKILGIVRANVVIIGGHTARRKKIAITTTMSETEIFARCGIEGTQQSI